MANTSPPPDDYYEKLRCVAEQYDHLVVVILYGHGVSYTKFYSVNEESPLRHDDHPLRQDLIVGVMEAVHREGKRKLEQELGYER